MNERFTSDERGVSEVVGSILVFALLVMLLSIMQTQAVPNQNQEVEFKHSLDVQSDLIQFHQIASSVAADGSDRSVSFNMGTGYPSRLLFFNPPRVQGQLETSDQATVTIANVEASNSEVDDYLTASANNDIELDTRRLEYSVDYNEFPNDPTTRYEYGVLYSEYEDGTVVENAGNIIDGTTINLLYMAGDYAESSTTEESLSVQGVSAPARSVTVTGTGSGCGDPLFIELPTNLEESQWQALYPSTGSNNICSIQEGSNPDTIEIRLDPTETYDLRMSRIGLEPGAATQTPHYIIPVDPGVTSAGVGQTASIEYEVRDRFNNPVSGAEVKLPTAGGGTTTKKTNDAGRVSTTVTTTSSTTFTAQLQAGTCSGSSASKCQAAYRVQVPGLNLNPASGVIVNGSQTGDLLTAGVLGGLDSDNTIGVDLKNTGSQEAKILRFRINHYSPDPNTHSPVDMVGPNGQTVTDIAISGNFKTQSNSNLDNVSSIPANSEAQFLFEFNSNAEEGHFFVMTVVYDTGERSLYFVSPEGVAGGGGGGGTPAIP